MDRVTLMLLGVLAAAAAGAVRAYAEPAATVGATLDRWQPLITESAQRFGIPEAWIRAVMAAESGGRTSQDGRPITSRAGAMGLMQVMPDTYEDMRQRYGLGTDPHDPRDNILAGADDARSPNYLLSLLKNSFEKDPKLAKLGLSGDYDYVIVTLPTDLLIAELGQGGGAKKDGVLFALVGALHSFPNEVVVQGQGVAVSNADRWGKLFLLTQMSAAAIEQAGVVGPIHARTALAAGDATAMQVNVIITARAAAATP